MSWTTILSHQQNTERFRQSYERDRLASTYLFVGLPGIGKRKFALKLAEVLLCENKPTPQFDSCGVCPACQQVRALTHPDLILISKPTDKAFIPVELFIGDMEHRRQTGLIHDIGLKPFRGGRKIAIVNDADFLNQEGANSLLKTLEEPPPQSLLILIGSSEQQQLPTIISRSQVIRFAPLTSQQVQSILESLPEFETSVPLSELAAASGGSVELAFQLAEQEVFDYRQSLFSQLATCDPGSRGFAQKTIEFVDAVGKDAAQKRERLILIADFAIAFFRQWYLQSAAADDVVDAALEPLVNVATRRWQQMDDGITAEIATDAIDRCLDLQRQVAANVNQATAVDAWLIDLGKICRGSSVMR